MQFGPDDIARLRRVREKKVNLARAMEHEFRKQAVDKPGGKFTVNLRGKDMLKFREMKQEHTRELTAWNQHLNSKVERTVVRNRRGDLVTIAASSEGAAVKNGAHAFARAILRPQVIERGEDGLLYRENPDGSIDWLNRCSITRPFFPCTHPACEWCAAQAATA